jgi:hypothetical protein
VCDRVQEVHFPDETSALNEAVSALAEVGLKQGGLEVYLSIGEGMPLSQLLKIDVKAR